MKKILVIDDEPSIRHALVMGLASAECEVDSAKDGKSGIQSGTDKPYDVLIVDLCLPDIDGLEVIRKIGSIFPETASIIITGNPEGNRSLNIKKHGVSAYLEKPLEMQTIKKAIEDALTN